MNFCSVIFWVALGYGIDLVRAQIISQWSGENGVGSNQRTMSDSCDDKDTQIADGFMLRYTCFYETQTDNITTDSAKLLMNEIDDPRAIQHILGSANIGRNETLNMMDFIKTQNLSLIKRKASVGPLVDSLGGAENLLPGDVQSLGAGLLEDMPGLYIKRLPQNSFDEYLEEVFVNGGRLPKEVLTDSEGHAICEKTFSVYSDIDTVEKMDKILPVLPCAPVEICNTIPTAIVESRLGALAALPWNCQLDMDENDDTEKLKDQYPQMVGCAKALVRKAVSSELNQAVFNSLGSLKRCADSDMLTSLVDLSNCTDLVNLGTSVDLLRFAQVKRRIRQKCTPADLCHPTNMTIANLVDMGSLSVDLEQDVLNQLSLDVICSPEFIDIVKASSNTPSRTRQTIAERCYKNKTLTSDDVATMGGRILLKLNLDKLRQSVGDLYQAEDTKTDLKRALIFEREDTRIRLLRRTMAHKLNVTDLVDSPSIAKEIPLSRFEAEVVNLTRDLGLDSNLVDLPDAKNKWGVKKLLTEVNAANITAEVISQIKSVARGFLSSHISQLNQDNPLTLAAALCEQENWPSKTVKAITREIIVPSLLRNTDANYMAKVTVTDVSVIGPECLMHFYPTELTATITDVCLATCEKIGSSAQLLTFPPQRRAMFKDVCLECLGKSGPSTTITEDDLDTLGHGLVAELTTELSRVDSTAFKNKVALFRQGCMSAQSLTSVRPLIESAFGSASDLDFLEILQMGDLIRALAADDSLAEVDEDALLEAAQEIMEDLAPTDARKQTIQQNCMRGLSESEQNHQNDLKQTIFSSIVSAFDYSLSVRKRRKRGGSLWSCDDIMAMGPSIVGATIQDLTAIDSGDFYTCLSQMSQYSNWAVSQRDALLQKVKDDIGGLCNLTSTDVVNLGYFALSMEETDIECLSMTEDDPVAALGFLSDWTHIQVTNLAHRYQQQRSVTADALSDIDVSTLGHILCGFHTTELELLTAEAFVGSSAQIGQLKACGIDQLTVLKTIATGTDAFGALSSWGAEVFSEIGIVIAALTVDDINQLTSDSIEGIQTSAIALFPPNVFSTFSLEQLASFSVEQAQALTSDQINSLTGQQLALINSILEPSPMVIIPEQGGGNQGSVGTRCGGQVTLTASCICLVYLYIKIY